MARCQLGKALEGAELWSQTRPETEACVRLDPDSPDGHYQLARIYRRLGLTVLADQQTSLQQAAALRQSEESVRRTETVTKFLVFLRTVRAITPQTSPFVPNSPGTFSNY